MKIVEFTIEDDLKNKGQKILVATAEDGSKWVVSGDPYFCTALVPYDKCFYTNPQ